MIVDSNSAAPLKYTDATYQTLLFVRANIYDVSGAPALEGTVNLALVDNGVYTGTYLFTAGKPYLVQKLVYTDNTYTTVDQTFGQDNDDVQCVDLASGGSGGGGTVIVANNELVGEVTSTLQLNGEVTEVVQLNN